MATEVVDPIRLVDPIRIERNPENPRLKFREAEMRELEASISAQGILVPLTIYQKDKGFIILDGERRWRCALKLNLRSVPAIIQPEPDIVTNIMMMFAIHKTRNDWDPLPTAIKLEKLRGILEDRRGRPPTEQELATAASLSRGEIRRYKNIAAIPDDYKERLLEELEKARPQQVLTVDHVLEAIRGTAALQKQNIIDESESDQLIDAIVLKFEKKILTSTVEPRLLTKIARAVNRREVSVQATRRVMMKVIKEPKYTISAAFDSTVAKFDFEHATEQLADRVAERLQEHVGRSYQMGEQLQASLLELRKLIDRMLRDARR